MDGRLQHRAVGAFLMHCGWNSVLEGISNGVVVLTWLMAADQYMDAKLLVDELGVGIRACEGDKVVPDLAQLGRVLVELIQEERPERARAEKLNEVVAASVSEGGRSVHDFDDFVKKLGELQCGRSTAN